MKTIAQNTLAIILALTMFLGTANAATFKYVTDKTGKTTITTRAGSKIILDTSKAYRPAKLDYLRLANFKDSLDRTVNANIKAKGKAYALSAVRKMESQYAMLYMDNSKNPRTAFFYSRASVLISSKVKELEKQSVVVTKPATTTTQTKPATTAGTTVVAPTTTKQLTSTETKTVVANIQKVTNLSTNASSIPAFEAMKNQYRSIGLSETDTELMAMQTGYGDNIAFCSAFTPEFYKNDLLKYKGTPQETDPADMDKYMALKLRVLSGGDIWFSNNHRDIYQSRLDALVRVGACAGVIGRITGNLNYSQSDMQALFGKMNLTFTPQTKAVYDTGMDLKDLNTWVINLGNGKQK